LRLLLDEMYPGALAEQLRARGHDVVSVHDAAYRHLEGAPDSDLFAAAMNDDRAILTENVADFRRLEVDALARNAPSPRLIFTTNRSFPRGLTGTVGRLVLALDAVLGEPLDGPPSFFLDAGPIA